MKIYMASSWKNETQVKQIAGVLRAAGHQVDTFCDPSTGRFVFDYSSLPNLHELTIQTAMHEPLVQMAYHEDSDWIDWSDGVVLVLPSGRSAHLEAGYAKGQGKFLIVYQESFSPGEFDVMYGFADLITTDLSEILEYLQTYEEMREGMAIHGQEE